MDVSQLIQQKHTEFGMDRRDGELARMAITNARRRRLAAAEPGFAAVAQTVIDTLLTKPEVRELWPRLSQLRS